MKIFTSGLVVVALALALYLLWGTDSDPVEQGETSGKKEKPIILQKPDLTDFENNRLTMRIQAEKARIFENKKLTLLSTVNGKLYSQEQEQKPTLFFADSGTIQGNSQLITLNGNVKVIFHDGQKLFTEKMNLDQKRELLYNKVAVRVESGEDHITAGRMRYSLKTGVLVLNRPKALIHADEL